MDGMLTFIQKACGQDKFRTSSGAPFPDTTWVPQNFWKGKSLGSVHLMLPSTQLPGATRPQFKSPSVETAAIHHAPLSQERLSFQRIIYCSICPVSKAHFHCSISSKGQACHHLSVLWCNNLKLENSPRTKSGTESGRHVQLQFMDASLQPRQFLQWKLFHGQHGVTWGSWKSS